MPLNPVYFYDAGDAEKSVLARLEVLLVHGIWRPSAPLVAELQAIQASFDDLTYVLRGAPRRRRFWLRVLDETEYDAQVDRLIALVDAWEQIDVHLKATYPECF